MKELKFKVIGQNILPLFGDKIVADSKNYFTMSFDFSDEWKNFKKTAVITINDKVYNCVIDNNGKIKAELLPVFEKGALKISVYGGDFLVTEELILNVHPSGYKTGITPPVIPPDIYTQLTKDIYDKEKHIENMEKKVSEDVLQSERYFSVIENQATLINQTKNHIDNISVEVEQSKNIIVGCEKRVSLDKETVFKKVAESENASLNAKKYADDALLSQQAVSADKGVVETIVTEVTAEADRAKVEADRSKVIADGIKPHVNDNFSNAIKNKVSGEVIAVDGVSPIEHNVMCKVSGVPDLTKVKVSRYGANILSLSDFTGVKDSEMDINILNSNTFNIKYNFKTVPSYPRITNTIRKSFNLKGQKVTLQIDKPLPFSLSLFFRGTSDIQGVGIAKGQTFSSVVLKDNYPTLDFIIYDVEVNTNVDVTFQLQLIVGDSPLTKIQAYIEPIIYTSTIDGNINGMTSLFPNMTLLTDTAGVNINATYNVDTKKYIDNKFEELKNAILSMGGNK